MLGNCCAVCWIFLFIVCWIISYVLFKKKKNLIMYLTTDILYPTLHLSSKWRIPVTLAILIFADFILILLQYMSKGYIIWFSSFIFFTVYNKRTEWGSCSSWNWKKKKSVLSFITLTCLTSNSLTCYRGYFWQNTGRMSTHGSP